MKIILTGATGFIGGEILSYCLRNPSITSIVALIRRHLPDSHLSGHTSDPQQLSKLQQCVIEDFTAPWPQTVFEACRGAEACIWALGSKTQKMDEARRVGLDFTINTVKQIQERLLGEANGQERKHFRFVVVSGIITVRDQSKSLWFLSDIRKLGVGLPLRRRFANAANSVQMTDCLVDTEDRARGKPSFYLSKPTKSRLPITSCKYTLPDPLTCSRPT